MTLDATRYHGEISLDNPCRDVLYRADMDTLISVPEAAERLRCHPQTVRRLIRAGEIPRVLVGRKIRLRPEDVTAWVEAHTTQRETP